MYAVDLHAHTRFFHGFPNAGDAWDPVGARLLGRAADRRGLDAVAVTNHDYHRDLPVEDGTGDDGPVGIPGIEVTTTRGHVLVVGPDPPRATAQGELTPEAAVALAHDHGCAAVIAHPYRNSTVRAADADFDAVEINGKGTRDHGWVRRLAAERDLPLVGGSDAHWPVEVGRAYTVVDADERSPEAVVAAVRDGRVEAHVDTGPFHRLLRSAYRTTHGLKGWLDRPDWDPPGLGTPPGERENRPG